MKPAVVALGIFLGVVAILPPSTSSNMTTTQISPLERAVKSSMLIRYKNEDVKSKQTYWRGGSATLISRLKKKDIYQYRALTAYHVIQFMQAEIKARGAKANRKMLLVMQNDWHGQPVELNIKVTLDWTLPRWDWSTFTFESPQYLECVQLATRKEFKQIKPGEEIYGMGGDGSRGLLLRKGIIGATHNIYPSPVIEKYHQQNSLMSWDQYPNAFFRPFTPIWYGASGGGIFNKSGKLIGMYSALNIRGFGPVPHGAVALKTYLVLELAKQFSPQFFVIDKK